MAKSRQITVPVSNALYNRVQRLIPWGQRATIICKLIEMLCDSIEEHPDDMTLVKFYSGRIQLRSTSDAKLSPEDAERAIGDYLRRKGTSEEDED